MIVGVYLLPILSHKKFEFENRGPLPSDFGFQSFACPARGSKVEICIILRMDFVAIQN